MSVWHTIDQALMRYRAELSETKAKVRGLGGRSLRVSETGMWRCQARRGAQWEIVRGYGSKGLLKNLRLLMKGR